MKTFQKRTIRLVSAVLISIVLASISILIVLAATETLRPDAVGDEAGFTASAGANWECVDDVTHDADATYVWYVGSDWGRDLYNLPAHAGTGVVNSVTVYYTVRLVSDAGSGGTKAVIKTGGVVFEGEFQSVPITYTEKSETWTVNPDTEVAFTWADIDAMQIGLAMQGQGAVVMRCTQVYAVVDYTVVSAPVATTKEATYVEQTTSRLNAYVSDDGEELCEVRFQYYTGGGGWTDNETSWVAGYETGDAPYVDVASLVPDTLYNFRVQIKNSDSTVNATGKTLTTEAGVAVPTGFKSFPASDEVVLSWTKGVGSSDVYIRYDKSVYPTAVGEGTLLYEGSATTISHTGLEAGETYYYSIWGKSGATYSGTYASVMATTTAEMAGVTLPSALAVPSTWFQTPDYTKFKDVPLFEQFNAMADAIDMPRGTWWLLSTLLGIMVLTTVTYLKSEAKAPEVALITLAVLLAVASLVELLPMFMMGFSVAFGLGAVQLGRR